MSKPETTRGNTMLKLAEKTERTQSEKSFAETTLLLRRIMANRQELKDLELYRERESQVVQPKTVFERIKNKLIRQKEQEIVEQAKLQARAELLQVIRIDENQLTSQRLDSLKVTLGQLAEREESILSTLTTLQSKVTSQQNDLEMLAWSLDNAFAYIERKDGENASCKTDTEPV